MQRQLLLLALAAPVAAQDVLPFPARMESAQPIGEIFELEQDPELLQALTSLEQVTLLDAPLPVGAAVDLRLERLRFDPRSVGVQVNGSPATYDPGDLTLWKGSVVGMEYSRVFLALSSHGSYGWIHDGLDTTHVSSIAGEGGDWSRAGMRLYSNRALEAVPSEVRGPICLNDELGIGGIPTVDPHLVDPPVEGAAAPLECKMAIETDYQLWKIWSNLQAEQNYVMALIGAVSDRFEEQLDVVITYPYVQFYNHKGDPWSSQDSGGGAGDLLNEFRSAWAGNIPAGGHLAHFLSGAGLGGGVAWVDTICSDQYGFAVSGNINGGVSFPVTQGSNTWDFFVMSHEAGHNFGSPHTHDYCPPLDECAPNCNGTTQCTTQGTNMSYCHGCSGGMTNITTYFHPTAASLMRGRAEASCLPDWAPGTPVVLFSEDFESGSLAAGGWTTGVQSPQVQDKAARYGTYGVRIRNKRWMEKTLDTTGYQNITIQLWRRTKNYEALEELRIRIHDGAGWTTLERANNPDWGIVTFDLPSSASNNPNLRIRLRSSGSEGRERGDVDDLVVTGEV